jgi:phosphoglycerate dehydrogenase-like enzyme
MEQPIIVPLDDLLARSDIISLHLPLTDRTRHLIDAATIVRMKPGAVLVNTAPGALVDVPAVRALPDGGDEAGSSASNRRHRNVAVSPQAAGTSEETIRRSAIVTVELVGRYLEGHPVEE